ncbi:leukocyte elastase inhibitor-like isoform X2 [Gordionus sp. m RMFG-2023]|uniref:leukocyte elastase inhibitor-like isoform X2 n=1 Tax=Gordionus sp. m RMFG-2023 TaxID=3053472 RepID=UPI0031FBD93A
MTMHKFGKFSFSIFWTLIKLLIVLCIVNVVTGRLKNKSIKVTRMSSTVLTTAAKTIEQSTVTTTTDPPSTFYPDITPSPVPTIFTRANSFAAKINAFALNILSTLVHSTSVTEVTNEIDGVHSTPSLSNYSTSNVFPNGATFKSGLVVQSNLAFSPTSLATVLIMIYLGSGGTTSTEITRLLGLSRFSRKDFDGFPVFLSGLNTIRSLGNVVLNAQRLVVQSNIIDDGVHFEVNPFYLSSLKQNYKADLTRANFVNDSVKVAREINEWVANMTQGHISEILRAESLHSFTRMLILDITYFHGEWEKAFDGSSTSLEKFYVHANKTIEVSMMKRKGKYKSGYLQSISAQFLEIPFKNFELSFYIMLPDHYNGQNLSSLIEKLDIFQLNLMLQNIPTFDTRIEVPKFSISSLSALFDSDKANLSMMITNSSSPLFVSEFKHKVSFSVDERGAKGAAVSQAIIEARSSIEDEFIANRPFLFIVVDNRVLSILFLGIINTPNPAKD